MRPDPAECPGYGRSLDTKVNGQDSGRQAAVPAESGIHFNTEGMKMLIVLHLTMQCKCSSIALQGMDGKKETMTCRVN